MCCLHHFCNPVAEFGAFHIVRIQFDCSELLPLERVGLLFRYQIFQHVQQHAQNVPEIHETKHTTKSSGIVVITSSHIYHSTRQLSSSLLRGSLKDVCMRFCD